MLLRDAVTGSREDLAIRVPLMLIGLLLYLYIVSKHDLLRMCISGVERA